MVFQWPCGAVALSLWSRGAHPRKGALLVLAQVSSIFSGGRTDFHQGMGVIMPEIGQDIRQR